MLDALETQGWVVLRQVFEVFEVNNNCLLSQRVVDKQMDSIDCSSYRIRSRVFRSHSNCTAARLNRIEEDRYRY